MNILVIGGSGFIGSEVVRYIQSLDWTDARSYTVDVMDLKRPQKNGYALIWFQKDIRERTLCDADFSPYDVVMVFAAVTSQLEFEKHPEESFATNVNGLFNVLEACRKSHVRKVMFASSAAIYGDGNGKAMSEEDRPDPRNMYATSKVVGEALVNAYTHKGYFDSLILRYFNVYGLGENPKGDYKSIISTFIEQIRRKGEVVIYGDGEQRRDFINVKDAARITFELAMHQSGTFNVGGGSSVSWNELLDWFETEGLHFRDRYIKNPIPDYQLFTEADVKKLESVGLRVEAGIKEGIEELIGTKEGRAFNPFNS